jgi:hypothetical protein
LKVELTPGGGFPGDWDCVHFCLIAFAKVIPKLVKNVLNRDDMDFVFFNLALLSSTGCSLPMDQSPINQNFELNKSRQNFITA